MVMILVVTCATGSPRRLCPRLAMTTSVFARNAVTKQSRGARYLLRLKIDRLDELPVLLVIAFEYLRELLGRFGDDGEPDRFEPLLNVGQHHRPVDLAVEEIDDVLRRARRSEVAEPA